MSKGHASHAQNGKSRHKAEAVHRREKFLSIVFKLLLPSLTYQLPKASGCGDVASVTARCFQYVLSQSDFTFNLFFF